MSNIQSPILDIRYWILDIRLLLNHALYRLFNVLFPPDARIRHYAIFVDDHDIGRGGCHERTYSSTSFVPQHRKRNWMTAQMTANGAGVLSHPDRHGKEVNLIAVLLVGRFQLRRQRFAVLTPDCPELDLDRFLAEGIT